MAVKKLTHGKGKDRPAKPGEPAAYVPTRIKRGRGVAEEEREEGGPLGWLLPALEGTYSQIVALDAAAPVGLEMAASSLQPDFGAATLAPAGPTLWRDLFLEYKQRKATAVGVQDVAALAALGAAPAPFLPGARNWLPLGPSVVLNGQTVGNQPVGGRVARLAISPGGAVVYAASANGGVFRSTDGGASWRSLMDRFDLDPTDFASASLVCGAIAIDPADPRRIYVGTGEGDTLELFRNRVTSALPAYRGVGVIRSDDGGDNWIAEPSTPDLAGEAFFDLAVDPANRDNVVGATTQGLYRRVPRPGGTFEWTQLRAGVYSSVVAASNGSAKRFFCAQWGAPGVASAVLRSDNGGATWTSAGTGFPNVPGGRIALAVRPSDPTLIYAFVADARGVLAGLFRLQGVTGTWRRVTGVPNVLPGKQGTYDLTIAIDPTDSNLVYLGGDHMGAPPWGGSVWRCQVAASGTGFRVASAASIGSQAHADVHHVVHTPGDRDELWCATDGGVFLNRDPRGSGLFAGQNGGLACLCSNFIAQHPTDPNLLFTGLQDNGTATTLSGPIWNRVGSGDGGYCLINWADPNRILAFANGTVYRSTSGGTTQSGWAPVWNFGWVTMTQPIVGAPYNPASPADAGRVAVGAGQMVFVSGDFATSWPTGQRFTIPGGAAAGAVFALAFASPTRLFVGTTRGQVFRIDRSGTAWSLTRIDDAAAGPLGLTGLITDVAVDWADPQLESVYVSFGGLGDRRRVWWYDGTRWQARSGTPGANDLLDVEHNALAVDRAAPNNVYVGADIGVWHSDDGGLNWQPLQNGLPDAPVFDLQIHPTQRLLRAATHGRGLYEIAL